MDQIRKHLSDGMAKAGVSMAELSRRLNRNEAYIQQFMRGKQQNLPYEERLIAAEVLDMSPQLLGVADKQRHRLTGALSGFSQDAVPYTPPRGHFLAGSPSHYWMLTQTSNSLDQHEHRILKGDVIVFNLNKNDPLQIPDLTIVAVQQCSREELTKSLGTATRVFIRPNKLITNSSDMNEIIAMDDDTLPYIPVLRGSFESVIRGLNLPQ